MPQMCFAEDYKLVQTLFANCAYEALSIWIAIRTLRCEESHRADQQDCEPLVSPNLALAAHSVVSVYERRAPESTLLYKVLQTQWRTFEAELNADSVCDGGGLPAFVHAEFESYLRCGIAVHGFVRVRCNDCADSCTVVFSCKRRGFCPSCIGRRMNETAAHLVDDVLPHAPVRQWVLSVPHGNFYPAF